MPAPVLVYCYPYYLLSGLHSPPPFPKYTHSIYRQCVAVGVGVGGDELCCRLVDHILPEFSTLFLSKFRTYKIATPPQIKITSKDDM
jgi:hypothetical protein